MSFEGMCARIKSMHTELEELEKALKEGVLDEGEKWTFPEDNYTVLAIWLLYDPRARRLFAVNERKSWVELAERLTKYVGWMVMEKIYAKITLEKACKTKIPPLWRLKSAKLSSHRSGKSSNFAPDFENHSNLTGWHQP